MGNYLTEQKYIALSEPNEVARLSNNDGESGQPVNTTFINECINQAESLANSSLVKRYSVPVSIVDPALERCVYDIARYYVHQKHKISEDEASIAFAYKQAIHYLKEVANGDKDLIGVSVYIGDGSGSGIYFIGGSRQFDDNPLLRGFRV